MDDQYTAYTVPGELPRWVKKGRTQFQNRHGGPAEVAKDILFQSSTITYSFDDLMEAGGRFYAGLIPELVWEWTNAYTDELLDEMKELGKDLIQVTYSCGFSMESEAIQREIVKKFTRRAHARGIRICAYLSLTNIFWKDAFEYEPYLKKLVARYSNGKAHHYVCIRIIF